MYSDCHAVPKSRKLIVVVSIFKSLFQECRGSIETTLLPNTLVNDKVQVALVITHGYYSPLSDSAPLMPSWDCEIVLIALCVYSGFVRCRHSDSDHSRR